MSPLDDQDRQRQQEFLRQWRRDQQRRRQRRNRWLGVAAAAVVALGVAAVAYAWMTDDGPPEQMQAAAPVRVELPADPTPTPATAAATEDDPEADAGAQDEVPADARQEEPDEQGDIPLPPNAPVRTDQAAPAKGGSGSGSTATPAAGSAAGGGSAGRAGSGSAGKPVVWVQAGHADPREPGYRDQTGASSGPFGGEIAFTTTLAPKLVDRLRAAGVDARQTPGQVTPWGAEGAVFISLHSDIPQGRMAIGHAITGAGENYYHGEGGGTASPTPYPDSAPHRDATTVSGAVESDSAALASALAGTLAPIYTAANGARAGFGGIQTRDGNPRMMRYYGFYRTRADARVLVELGAGDTDDAFLARTDLIATALSAGVVKHLRAQGQLG